MSDVEKTAFAYIDEHFDEAVSFWKKLVEAESPFWNKLAVDRTVSLMEEYASSMGLSVRRCPSATTGDGLVVMSDPKGSYEHGVALSAHLDTVHEIGVYGPTPVRVEDGWMYGPGTGDCKGGAVMALYILLALRHAGYSTRPIKLIFVGNEEGGRPEVENYIPPELAGSDVLFNCETGQEHGIVTSRKASIGAIFTVRGTAKHVGDVSSQPASAIHAAARKILSLESLSDYENRTFSCGEIRGGSIFTSVPAECTFKVNCRIRSADDIEWLKNVLEETAIREDAPNTTSSVRLTGNIIPMSPSSGNDALFTLFDEATHSLGYERWTATHSGGGSDASYAVMLGIPAICATGVLASGPHTLVERANIEDFRKRARIHIRTILDLPQGSILA